MGANDLPAGLLRRLRPAEVRRYALAAGWRRNEAVNGRVAVFQHPESDLDQLIVPADGSDPDGYAVLMDEAVRKIGEWEHRPPVEVLNDLLLPPADVLRFRNASPESEAGSLPLDQTVQMLTGVRRLLSAAAHSALTPQPYYPRLRRSEAEEFVGRCQVGQTERGSYTVAVACPLDLPPSGSVLFENPPAIAPFPRQVTGLLMDSLAELARVADLNRADELTDLGRHPGFSANFCEALALLRPAGDRSSLGVTSSWSRLLPSPDGGRPARAEVELRQEAFDAAEYLAPRFRSATAAKEDRFIGFVEELRGQTAPDALGPSGEVWLSVWDEGDFVRARTYLTAAQYAEANAAHMANGIVSLKGVLRRLPRLRQIEKVADFKVLTTNDPQ